MAASPGELLDQAWEELEAAETLFVRQPPLARAAAVHAYRCWQAVAAVRAHEQGREPAESVTAAGLLADELLGITITASPAGIAFSDSYAALAAAAGGRVAQDGQALAEQELSRHLRLLRRALGAAERRLVASRKGARLVGRWRLARHSLRRSLVGYVAVVVVLGATLFAAVTGQQREQQPPRCDQAQARAPEQPLGKVVVEAAALTRPMPAGTPWDAAGTVRFRGTLVVSFGKSTPAPHVDLSLDANDLYELRWLLAGQEVGELTLVGPSDGDGLHPYRAATGAAHIDAVVIAARSGDGLYSVGHLIPVSP